LSFPLSLKCVTFIVFIICLRKHVLISPGHDPSMSTFPPLASIPSAGTHLSAFPDST
jgi:hypothetical protein